MQSDEKKTTSEVLQDVADSFTEDSITLFEIKNAIRERGFAILMLVFAMPLSIPLPVPPGLTTVASIPLLLFSVQIMVGVKAPWLPQWLGNKSIKRETLATIVEKTSPILKKLESVTKPRFHILTRCLSGKAFGILSLLCSLSIAIPLPLTNFIPAIGIVLLSLGLLNNDGAIMLMGIAVSAIGLLISFLVIVLGPIMIISFINKILGTSS